MSDTFLDLTGLTRYDSKLKAIAGGSLSLTNNKVLALLSISGETLNSVTLPDMTIADASSTASGLMTSAQYTKLENIAANATKVEDSSTNGNIKINGTETTVYSHPSGKTVSSGLYKITTNSTGHVTAATAVAKSDITDLGIPAENTTYSAVTANADGLMTSAQFSKLAGIDSGAEVNVIESVSVNSTPLPINSKGVNIDLSAYALKTDITTAVIYKGQVNTYSNLPASPATGDMYNVAAADSTVPINAGDNVVWNGSSWDIMAGTVEFSSITNAQIDALFA